MKSKNTKRENFVRLCNKACLSCQIDCCRKWRPFASEYDKKRIRKVNKDENLFNGNLFNTQDKRCPFYDQHKKVCQIHNQRPLDCRIYPYSFWFEMGRLDLWLDLKCPIAKLVVGNKELYKETMSLVKKELAQWSEGEIIGYLLAGFEIEKFKKRVLGKEGKKKFYKNKNY